MKLKADSSEQKLRGAYYTPLPLAKMMVGLFKNDANISSVMEPSCGDGVFVEGLIKTEFIKQLKNVTAIEIDPEEADVLKEKMKSYSSIEILNCDFFEYYQKNYKKQKYDLILGNPPYIRYQYLEELQRFQR